MRTNLFLLAVLAVAGTFAASNATAAGKEPTCSELASERAALVQDARRYTAQVEAKNLELGEAAAALSAAKAAPRQKELNRRAEGFRRELIVLLDRELEATNRLGYLDSQIGKRCKKGGGK